jgi:polar amino acid transport system substrate-binding protein
MKHIAPRIGLALALALPLAAVAGLSASPAQQLQDPRVADLVQSGVLRLAVGVGSPLTAIKNSTTGELKGAALEMGRALSARIGTKLTIIEYPRPGAVIDGLHDQTWDVSALVFDPERTSQVDFSNPYLQTDYTYLVAAGSPIRAAADMDQPGIRIATPRGDASDLYLTRMLKHATLIRAESHAAAIELVRTGGADAKASPRPVLIPESAALPGSRVLNDGFADIQFAVLVPKGQAARLAYVNAFVEDAKASGLVKRIIETLGLQGVRVAPAGGLSLDR